MSYMILYRHPARPGKIRFAFDDASDGASAEEVRRRTYAMLDAIPPHELEMYSADDIPSLLKHLDDLKANRSQRESNAPLRDAATRARRPKRKRRRDE